MVYTPTAHNRTVYAAPAVVSVAHEKMQLVCVLCAFFLWHIFAVAGNLRFPLQPQKCQSERYMISPKTLSIICCINNGILETI